MSELEIGLIIGLIFGVMIGAIIAFKYSDKRIGEHLTDMSTAFRGVG